VVEPYPSEKYEFVSWDDEIQNIWKNKKMFQTTNQLIKRDPLYLPNSKPCILG
jgi:hypothetical protein